MIIMKNEAEFVDKIALILLRNGFKIIKEAIPDECKLWENPYRIDLLCLKNNDIWIIEAKDCSLRAGGEFAKAFEQIQKYRNLHFSGKKATKLIIAPNYDVYNLIAEDFIQHFFNHFKISILSIQKQLIIDFCTKKVIRFELNPEERRKMYEF